jgi:hypothetical protein
VTETDPAPAKKRASRSTRRFGYLVAVSVNLVLLYVVNNLLAWDVLPWLTDDFEQILPILNLSLLATMVINVVYVWFDPGWFKSLTQIGLSVISLVVVVRLFRVFPFDFSPYESGWATLTRFVLIFVMIGLTIGIIAESAKFITGAVRAAGAGPTVRGRQGGSVA